MKNIKLVVNNFASENNIYFNKKELKTILNLYARMVSDGFWKDSYGSVNGAGCIHRPKDAKYIKSLGVYFCYGRGNWSCTYSPLVLVAD